METMEEETMQMGMLMRIRIFREEKKKKNKTTKKATKGQTDCKNNTADNNADKEVGWIWKSTLKDKEKMWTKGILKEQKWNGISQGPQPTQP